MAASKLSKVALNVAVISWSLVAVWLGFYDEYFRQALLQPSQMQTSRPK